MLDLHNTLTNIPAFDDVETIEDIIAVIKSLNEQINDLKEKQFENKKVVNEKNELIVNQHKYNETLKQENRTLKQDNQTLKQDNHKLKRTLEAEEELEHTFNTRINTLQESLAYTTHQLKGLDNQLKTEKDKNKMLESKVILEVVFFVIIFSYKHSEDCIAS